MLEDISAASIALVLRDKRAVVSNELTVDSNRDDTDGSALQTGYISISLKRYNNLKMRLGGSSLKKAEYLYRVFQKSLKFKSFETKGKTEQYLNKERDQNVPIYGSLTLLTSISLNKQKNHKSTILAGTTPS